MRQRDSLKVLLLALGLVSAPVCADSPGEDGDPVAAAMDAAYQASRFHGFGTPPATAPLPPSIRPRQRLSRAGVHYGLGQHKSLNFSVLPRRTRPGDGFADDGLGINPSTGADQPHGWSFTFSREF